MKEKTIYRGVEQLKEILTHILTHQEYPKWDFINGVLSCEEVLGEYELWLHWGELLIVPVEKKYKGITAGDCEKLKEWIAQENGKIKLVGEING